MNYQFNVTVRENKDLPKCITDLPTYKPTLDFNKSYTVSENEIKEEYESKGWSSKDAVIKSIVTNMAHNDGLNSMGNWIDIKKI
jgi:hypothetical protein